ncbi:SU10 major capsid protein [Paenibacillus naphthalenovorans]|uniref:SU10 major capsid protein n=1 Tax=Paenibacillus naphthalenovorans TaxID=162209 RepID=UPI003D2D9A6B
MPNNVSGNGTVWNLPNYAGELFTSDAEQTPFLTMIGGLTDGGLQTANFEFPTDSQYSYPAATQPAITETASLTAPTAISYVRDQSKNVTQIFHEKVSVSYAKMSNGGRLSGINTAGASNNVITEKDFQISRALGKIARDVEYTFLNGTYQIATSASVANKTRGMYNAVGSTVEAAGAQLSKGLLQQLFRTMYSNGAIFSNMVLWVNAYQKQKISDIYGYAPTDRNVGGVNIKQIETDFGNIGVMLNRFNDTDKIGAFEMSVVAPVFQPVPGKGNFFYEELSKNGAAEEGQLYGQIGLDHGPVFMHGSITGLATS